MSIKNNNSLSLLELHKKVEVSEFPPSPAPMPDTIDNIIPNIFNYNLSIPLLPIKQVELLDLESSDLIGPIYKAKWYGIPVKSHVISVITITSSNLNLMYKTVLNYNFIMHPGLIQVYGVAVDLDSHPIVIEEEMSYTLSDIMRLSNYKRNINIKFIIDTAVNILNTLSFLYSFNPPYCHGSITPSFIYFDKNFTKTKLGDMQMYSIYETSTKDILGRYYQRSNIELGVRCMYDDLYNLGIVLLEMTLCECICGNIKSGLDNLKMKELKPIINLCISEKSNVDEILKECKKLYTTKIYINSKEFHI